MNEEMNQSEMGEMMEMDEAGQAMDAVQSTLETFMESARVDIVYGEPFEHGDALIIPTAEVLSLLGFGVGAGYGSGTSENTEQPAAGTGGGGGGGGGGRILSRPVAVVVASPEGVRVEPIVDVTKLGLAALTAGGFMAAMILRMISPAKAMRELRGD